MMHPQGTSQGFGVPHPWAYTNHNLSGVSLMRRWYFASAAIASIALVGIVGFLARSTQAQEATSVKAADASTSKLASSRIDRVTVYPQNALVTREVEVPAGNGLIELTVPAMPDQIV